MTGEETGRRRDERGDVVMTRVLVVVLGRMLVLDSGRIMVCPARVCKVPRGSLGEQHRRMCVALRGAATLVLYPLPSSLVD